MPNKAPKAAEEAPHRFVTEQSAANVSDLWWRISRSPARHLGMSMADSGGEDSYRKKTEGGQVHVGTEGHTRLIPQPDSSKQRGGMGLRGGNQRMWWCWKTRVIRGGGAWDSGGSWPLPCPATSGNSLRSQGIVTQPWVQSTTDPHQAPKPRKSGLRLKPADE